MQHEFLKHFKQHFGSYTANLAVAVSGGLDSVVLCHLLKEAQINFSILHCNFKLRGQESNDDATFVKNLAQQYQCCFYYHEFNTKNHIQQHHCSIQIAARDLRYQWFKKLMKTENLSGIATAHHLNDQIETFFINLLRGTGIKGLTGIPEINKNIIRPLLPFTRAEILDYAEKHQLAFREDSSNLKDDYLRNKIRHHLVPMLSELNQHIHQTFAQSLQNFKFAEHGFNKHIEQIKKNCTTIQNEEIRINKNFLHTLPYQEFYLFELLKEFQFNFSTVQQLVANLEAQAGKQFHSETHTCINDREFLYITPKNIEDKGVYYIEENCKTIQLENQWFNFETFPFTSIENIEKSAHAAYLDKSKLNFPLLLRKWKPGDRMKPLGMQQYKKISDMLVDLKIPLHKKNKLWVVTSGEDIVWLAGFRIGHDFKCTEDTTDVLKISITVAL